MATVWIILGDPEADSGGEGKSKRAEKYGTKKRKERREEPLGTMIVFTIEPKWAKKYFKTSKFYLLQVK